MTQQIIIKRLVEICHEEGVLRHANHPDIANSEFSHCGIDSVALEFLQAVIEDEWRVHIPATFLATKLHNLNSIALYVAEQVSSDSHARCDTPFRICE